MNFLEKIFERLSEGWSVQPCMSKKAVAMFRNLSEKEIDKMHEMHEKEVDDYEVTGIDGTKYRIQTVGRIGVSLNNGKIKSITQ